MLVCLEVPGRKRADTRQNEQVTIAAFTNGLMAGAFSTEIHRKYPRTFREFWRRVDKGIQSEDINRMKREAQTARLGQDT